MKITSCILSLSLAALLSAGPSLAYAQLGGVVPPSPSTPSSAEVQQQVQQIVTPPADTTGPVISGVAALSLLSTTAEIVWATDELAVSGLHYGVTESLGSTATLPTTALLVHGVVLTGLLPSTTYHYCIDATDVVGNVTHSCSHTFTTAAASVPSIGDTNPPTVSIVSAASVTSSSVVVTWTTDEVADAQVEYGTEGYDLTSALDTNLALTHSAALNNLSPNTTYHYRVRSSDEFGNVAYSPDETFTTLSTNSGQAAPLGSGSSGSISSGDQTVSALTFSSVESTSITQTGVAITWTTSLPGDSQVEYGESENFGYQTPLSAVLATSHSVSVAGLSPGTNYLFRVKSKPAGASAAVVSAVYEFNTLAAPELLTQPANITAVAASSTTISSATVTWNTDIAATSQVEYGVSTAYGQTSTPSNLLVASHSVVLSSLAAGTLYHYRVKSVTEAGDITYSDDHAFATTLPPGSVGQGAPVEVETLSVLAHDQTSATLSWHVEGDTDAAAGYEIRSATFQINSASYAQASLAQETTISYADLSPNGASRTYVVAGLDPNTTYYFALKSKYQHSDWSAVSNIASVTTSASAQGSGAQSGGGGGSVSVTHAPTLVSASGEDGQIVFNWKNAKEDSYVHTVVVRKKEGSYPTSPTDGEAIYEGRSETFTDTNLENGKTYYYGIYSFDRAKHYSVPVRVSLTPKSGTDEVKLQQNPNLIAVGSKEHFVRELKKGDKDIEVEHLQQLLLNEGIYTFGKVTGYFGGRTEVALKAFQKKHNLPQSGVTDAATRTLLAALSQNQIRLEVPGDALLFTINLRQGATGGVVEALQEFLIREGSYRGTVTGSFDVATKAAVMAFQKKYNIQPSSGYVGPKTRHVIQTISGF